MDPQGINSGVMHLNMMLAQWQRRRWLVPNLVDMALPRASIMSDPVNGLDADM